MIEAIERSTRQLQMHELLHEHGPMTAGEIARGLGIHEADASASARADMELGFLDRDEFGRYTVWCAWPRVGL